MGKGGNGRRGSEIAVTERMSGGVEVGAGVPGLKRGDSRGGKGGKGRGRGCELGGGC